MLIYGIEGGDGLATLNMGNSNIIGISYSEMNKMKSNLKRSQQMLETSQRNVSTARVQLQVDRGRLRVTEDSLSSIYTEESKRKAKIDKMCSNIDYTIRRFKEVDSRCAQRIRSIGNIYNSKTSVFDKIKNVMISLGRYLFGGGTSLLNEGQYAFNNLGNSNSNGYYSFIGRGAGVGNYSAMANSQYSMGGLLLAGTNMFASYANKYPTIGMNYSGAGGGKVDNEDTKEDGYIWKSIKQVFLGNYTDEHTGLGSVGQIALGFTGIDFLADGRDLVYDFTHWSWTWDHGKQTAFDMIALMPIIGVSKNIKNAAKYADLEKDVLKNSEKLIDGIKPIEKGADITKGVSKVDNFTTIRKVTAEETNSWWKNVMGYDNPPYKPGTMVEEIKLTKDTTFVRVYDGEVSGMYGGWVMKAEDIAGLTPKQIQDKFALPSLPKYMADVKLTEGTTIRKGIVNPLEGWGNGGGIQYDLMGQRVGEFLNPRELP